MQMQLISGQFSKKDATELLSKLTDVKIKFHEDKIKLHDSEEDVKYRERKIIGLQNNLKEALISLQNEQNFFSMDGIINVN